MILQLLILEGDPKGGLSRLTNEIKTTPADHQPICFPYSRFLILGISLSEVRDTVAVLNAQKSISKEDVVFLLMAEGFLLVYDRNKEMKETRYIYFEDLVLMFLFEQKLVLKVDVQDQKTMTRIIKTVVSLSDGLSILVFVRVCWARKTANDFKFLFSNGKKDSSE
ncbi:hypothetical protein NC652_038779 [Populus alba x Populus x berolinensis]|nr:hypothetical protein NC652_038779 [Populus alba x Populus x berolinensis]